MNSFPKQLKFAPGIWRALMLDLEHRGRGRRESGAFLLADASSTDQVIRSWLPYDILAPESIAFDYVRLESSAFSRLWGWCAEQQTEVIADVHTHPTGPIQSISDRAHPMIALAGHVALIVPRFARADPRPFDCSFNLYLGNLQWMSYFRKHAERLIFAQ